MVIFDRLEISDNGKMLYLDVHVNKASHFDGITIDKVIIQTSEQVSETDPLTPGDNFIYSIEAEEGIREMHLALDACSDFDTPSKSLSDKLLFVYVICKGVPGECTPCRLDEMTTLGVTFDTKMLYQKVMQLTRELNYNCSVPKSFIDLLLLWNGFKAAVETEHYIVAIDFWKKIFQDKSVITQSKCGCHG